MKTGNRYITRDEIILSNQLLERQCIRLRREKIKWFNKLNEILPVVLDDAYSIREDNLDKDQKYYLKLIQGNLSDLKQYFKLKREDEEE